MFIKKIKTTNFRNLDNSETQFHNGLNVLKGPNEVGKTSLLKAISFSLFGDATSSSSEIQVLKHWNSESSFSIEFYLEDGNKIFIITRDCNDKKNLLILPDGTSLKDKKRIQEKVIDLIGLPSEKCFMSTICINQDDIRNIDAGLPEIKRLLEEKISGGGIDPNEILKSVGKENAELKRAGSKNPGTIKQAENRLIEIKNQFEKTKEVVEKVEGYKKDLNQVLEDLQRVSKDIEFKKRVVENAKKFIDAENRFEEASKKYDELDKMIERRKISTEELERVSKELKVIDSELENKKEQFNKSERFLKLATEKEGYDKTMKQISSDIDRLTSLEKELAELERKISLKKEIDEKDYRNALSLPNEIDNLATALSAQEIVVSLMPNEKFTFTYKADDLEEKIQELERNEKVVITGKEHIQMQIDNLANLDILSKGEKIRVLLTEYQRKTSVLLSIFKRYDVSNIEELKLAWEERQGLLKNRNDKLIEYKTILNNRDLKEIKNEKNQLLKGIESLDEELNKVKEYFITTKEFEMLKTEIENLHGKNEDLKKSMHISMGSLKELKDEDKLKVEQKISAKEMAIFSAELKELEMFKCTGEEFLRYESELRELQEKSIALNARKRFLEMAINENENIGIEDIANLEERLSFITEEIYRLNKRAEINDVIYEAIEEARVQTIKDISDNLCKKVEENLSYITNNKYRKIKLGESLDVSIWSDQKNDWIGADNFYLELSSGLFDQVYFAVRLALLEALIPQKMLPIFMDDPFIHFDTERRKKALELCKKLSGRHQILVFTCHDYCDGFADAIIDLNKTM